MEKKINCVRDQAVPGGVFGLIRNSTLQEVNFVAQKKLAPLHNGVYSAMAALYNSACTWAVRHATNDAMTMCPRTKLLGSCIYCPLDEWSLTDVSRPLQLPVYIL
jgi:hypothetical protein